VTSRLLLLVLLGAGCSDDASVPRRVVYLATGDGRACAVVAPVAGDADAGLVSDAGSAEVDSGPVDAGALDTGPVDAGALDAGAVDAGAVDAGAVDAGAVDAGAVDAGALDAGAVDAGTTTTDAGPMASANVGNLRCWGGGETRARSVINGLPDVGAVALGVARCALDASGRIWCWGSGEAGELGDGTRGERTQAFAIPGVSGADAIAASRFVEERGFACARFGEELQCWGANDRGQLGDGSAADRARPGEVPGLDQVRDFALGDAFGCAVEGSSVFCWGANEAGQLGESGPDRRRPVEVTALGRRRFAEVATGAAHACALDVAGTVWCWGADSEGQLGRGGTLPSRPTPAEVGGLPLVVEVAAGARHTCARTMTGEVYCWGANDGEQVGQAGVPRETRPRRVALEGALGLSLGDDFSCALVVDGVRCWGANEEGQLGNDTTIGSSRTSVVRGL